MAPTAPVVHGSGGGCAVFVGDVDEHFDVFLGHYVSDGQILDVRTRARVFPHAQRGSSFARNVGSKQIVDLLVVNLVTGDFDVKLVLVKEEGVEAEVKK